MLEQAKQRAESLDSELTESIIRNGEWLEEEGLGEAKLDEA